MKLFILTGPVTSREILIEDDEMIVYEVIKIADYESADFVQRTNKKGASKNDDR